MIKKQMFSKKLMIFLIPGLFFCFLTFLHFTWMNFTNISTGVNAIQGTVDLRSIDTSRNFKVKLQKEWEFYPNVLLTSENAQSFTNNE